jgi:DNA polymerase III delta prime subunit
VQLPHLLFYGPPGTGKTSTILALARELYGSALSLPQPYMHTYTHTHAQMGAVAHWPTHVEKKPQRLCVRSRPRGPICDAAACTMLSVSLAPSPSLSLCVWTLSVRAGHPRGRPELFKRRVLELNASDERGIKVVREKIRTFAQESISANDTAAYGAPQPLSHHYCGAPVHVKHTIPPDPRCA